MQPWTRSTEITQDGWHLHSRSWEIFAVVVVVVTILHHYFYIVLSSEIIKFFNGNGKKKNQVKIYPFLKYPMAHSCSLEAIVCSDGHLAIIPCFLYRLLFSSLSWHTDHGLCHQYLAEVTSCCKDWFWLMVFQGVCALWQGKQTQELCIQQ